MYSGYGHFTPQHQNTHLLLGCLQRISSIHNSRTSLLSIQIKTKRKNPWNPLKITNIYWNAVEASLAVRAPKSHVRPNITTSPAMEIINFINLAMVDHLLCLLFIFLMEWWISTFTTAMKTIVLKTKSRNMGAKRVTKNTVGSLMKQLWRKIHQ